MDWYKDCKLIKDGDEYTVEIYLNSEYSEFSQELTSNLRENLLDMNDEIRQLVDVRFSDFKVKHVKLMMGALMVASIPFMSHTKVHAAETSTTQQSYSETTTGIVTASRLNMRTGPSTAYPIMHVLWQGNVVKVIGESGDWYKIQLSDGRTGWVSKVYLQVDSKQEKINIVISTAKSLLGTPYVWGGESPQEGGFDCSGFTQYVYKQAGYTLNRLSSDQAKQGTYVSRQNLQPGDLVFYSFEGNGVINHVGIYIGNGQMIHSPKTGDVVKTTDITTSYWESRFVTARRIVQ